MFREKKKVHSRSKLGWQFNLEAKKSALLHIHENETHFLKSAQGKRCFYLDYFLWENFLFSSIF